MTKEICKHKSFWPIYKILNFNKNFSEDNSGEYSCKLCGKNCRLKYNTQKDKKPDLKRKIIHSLIWILPSLIIIILVANQYINKILAIGLLTAFHFISMYLTIKSDKLIVTVIRGEIHKTSSKYIRNTILGLIFSLLFVYLGFILFLYINQKSMLYFPDTKAFEDCTTFEKEETKEYKTTRFYESSGEKNNLVVFFHGNAGRACDRQFIKSLIKKTGNHLIVVEYSGYADNGSNKPNIKDILKDVENIGEYIETKNFDRVISMGRSVGTGPASYLASISPVQKVLLISPYSELYKVAAEKFPIFPVKYLFSENFKNNEYLRKYSNKSNYKQKNELLIIHGSLDKVVPINHSKELYKGIKSENKDYLELKNGTHHNIYDFEEVNKKIIEYLN